MVFLLFPSTSAAIFATFQCEELDNPKHSRYLRIDLSVDCDSDVHRAMVVYAALMVFVYPLGVPAMYAYILFYRFGNQLELLRRIELQRVALQTADTSKRLLNDAREAVTKDDEIKRRPTFTTAFRRVSLRPGRQTAAHNAQVLRRVLSSAENDPQTPHRAVEMRKTPQMLHTMKKPPTMKGPATPEQLGTHSDLRRWERSSSQMSKVEELADQLAALEEEENSARNELPLYAQKLILGYELRTFYFELVECFRKLAIVCAPVFFDAGSVPQLIFGLVVCFMTFGAHMLYAPYVDDVDDYLAQLCQFSIFFSLLLSVALKYDLDTREQPSGVDCLLSVLALLPVIFAIYLESPLYELLTWEWIAAQITCTPVVKARRAFSRANAWLQPTLRTRSTGPRESTWVTAAAESPGRPRQECEIGCVTCSIGSDGKPGREPPVACAEDESIWSSRTDSDRSGRMSRFLVRVPTHGGVPLPPDESPATEASMDERTLMFVGSGGGGPHSRHTDRHQNSTRRRPQAQQELGTIFEAPALTESVSAVSIASEGGESAWV